MTKIYKNLMVKNFNMFLVKLPTPINISVFWNFGSLLGMFLLIQIISGILLSMHYVANVNYSFFSIIHIMQDVNYGWMVRLFHMNGASFFFMCVYVHIGRGLYYGSYKLKEVWFIGILILFLMMGTAFMGYVLPWGQMSFWGATVITNLLSALPYIGLLMVEWLWGGFSVDNATLNRFYSFHFIMPFILLVLVIFHLIFLHLYGSNNPLGVNSNLYKIKFHSYFLIKDIVGFILLFYLFFYIVLEFPYILGDSENFLMANSMVTPVHIQPEWYFLFAYTILRCIPNKLSGVIALMLSILILFFMLFMTKNEFQSNFSYPINQIMYWMFVSNFFLLTWLGSQPVEHPFIMLSQLSSLMYFLYYFINYFLMMIWHFF